MCEIRKLFAFRSGILSLFTSEKRKLHKKKKKIAQIVSFDEDDGISSSPGSSVTSPGATSTRSFDLSSRAIRSSASTGSFDTLSHAVRPSGHKKGSSLARKGSTGAISGSLPTGGFVSVKGETTGPGPDSGNKTHTRNFSAGNELTGEIGALSLPMPKHGSSSSLPCVGSKVEGKSPQVPSKEIGSIPARQNRSAKDTRTLPNNEGVSSSKPNVPSALDIQGAVVRKQPSNESTRSEDSFGNSPPTDSAARKQQHALSSGYGTQSSDSSQDWPPVRAANGFWYI